MKNWALLVCLMLEAPVISGAFIESRQKGVEAPGMRMSSRNETNEPILIAQTRPKAAPSPAPVLDREQQAAVEQLVSFFNRFESTTAGDKLRRQFVEGRMRIGPVPDNDIADTNVDTGITTLNEKMTREIMRRGTEPDFRAKADWAATITHEYVHQEQHTPRVISSNIQDSLGGGSPHELSAWGGGFQAYLRWIYSLKKVLNSGSEADQAATASEVSELCKGFLVYRMIFLPKGFGTLFLTGENGEMLSFDDATDDVRGFASAAAKILAQSGFSVVINPRVLNAVPGEVFTLTAGIVEGDPQHPTRPESVIYMWYADDARLPETTRTLRRTATKSERIKVVVQDPISRKRDSTCVVTVRPAPASAKPCVPGDPTYVVTVKNGPAAATIGNPYCWKETRGGSYFSNGAGEFALYGRIDFPRQKDDNNTVSVSVHLMVYREKLSNLSDLKLFVSNGGGTPEPVEMAGLKGWGARMPTKITEGDRLSNVLMAKFHSEAQGHFSFHRNDIFLLLEYRLSGTSTDEDDAVFRAKNEQLLSEAEKILKTVRIIGSPDEATQAAPAATTGVGPAKSA